MKSNGKCRIGGFLGNVKNYGRVPLSPLAFYAYPHGQQIAGTSLVYRVWSDGMGCHFYMISESETNKLVDEYSHVWTYEGSSLPKSRLDSRSSCLLGT